MASDHGRPLIGITCGTDAERGAAIADLDRQNSSYARAVIGAGGTPVLLSNVCGVEPAQLLERLDGLLLAGGRDVDPAAFGQVVVNGTVDVDLPRDAFELPLIRCAWERRTPILAICRGIQVLNVALGGTLVQDLPAQRPSAIAHRQQQPGAEPTHRVSLSVGSLWRDLVRSDEVAVNSFHHQAVDELAEALRVSAVAPDGVIEGLDSGVHPDLVAVQHHPELLVGVSTEARALFDWFVAAAGRRMGVQRCR